VDDSHQGWTGANLAALEARIRDIKVSQSLDHYGKVFAFFNYTF
jgi:hypothetical protein